jgi:hypothetical protein
MLLGLVVVLIHAQDETMDGRQEQGLRECVTGYKTKRCSKWRYVQAKGRWIIQGQYGA